MKKILKRMVLILLIIGISYTSFLNCFGKFSLTRKVYQLIDGLNIGSGKVQKVVKTVILWITLITFIDPLIFFIDFVILNLIEFWTDSNPLGLNEYNKDGIFVKKLQKGDEKIVLKYSDFGSRLDIQISNGKKSEDYVVLNGEPGKIFQEEDGKLKELSFRSEKVGQKLLIQVAKNGKLKSSKVVEVKDYKSLENKVLGGTL